VLTDEAMHYSFTDGTSCGELQLNFLVHPMCSRKMKKDIIMRNEGTAGYNNKTTCVDDRVIIFVE
jgi:hypothetical protein